MSTTDFAVPTSYDDVARLRGQRPLLYEQFGSYQGEWVLFAVDDAKYHIYKGWYGSCSGCDVLEGSHFPTPESVKKFLDDYLAFVDMPRQTAKNLVAQGQLGQVFPANMRDDFEGVPFEAVVSEVSLLVKLEEGLPITNGEILATRNQETRRRAIEARGIASFMAEMNAQIIHIDGVDKLVRLTDFDAVESTYLWLQDASTDREYVLRVPTEMERVQQAKAWTFNIPEPDYAPLIET